MSTLISTAPALRTVLGAALGATLAGTFLLDTDLGWKVLVVLAAVTVASLAAFLIAPSASGAPAVPASSGTRGVSDVAASQAGGNGPNVGVAVPGRTSSPPPARHVVHPLRPGPPDLASYGDSSLVAQCPVCGEFRVDVTRSTDGFAFACPPCGERWSWAPGRPWPGVTVSARRRRPAGEGA